MEQRTDCFVSTAWKVLFGFSWHKRFLRCSCFSRGWHSMQRDDATPEKRWGMENPKTNIAPPRLLYNGLRGISIRFVGFSGGEHPSLSAPAPPTDTDGKSPILFGYFPASSSRSFMISRISLLAVLMRTRISPIPLSSIARLTKAYIISSSSLVEAWKI